MSIERHGSGYEIMCDFCNRKPEFYEGDFTNAWRLARKDGWRCSQEANGTWVHRCPQCAQENP